MLTPPERIPAILPGTRWYFLDNGSPRYEWSGTRLWVLTPDGQRICESLRTLEAVVCDPELTVGQPKEPSR